MKKYIITIVILFLLIVLSICGCFVYANFKSNEGNSNDMLKEKALSQINFLNTEIIDIMNELNNISFSNYKIINKDIEISEEGKENDVKTSENTIDRSSVEYETVLDSNNNNVNWNEIKETTENIYSSWTTILIDLTTLNVNKDNLLKFNDLLDQIITAEEEKNKEKCLINCSDLYNLLCLYLNDFCNDNQIKNIYNTKSNILYAYSYIESDNFDRAKEYLINGINEFNKIMNNQVNNIDSMDEINKSYILINELLDDVNKENKKTFYINYQELMPEIDNI